MNKAAKCESQETGGFLGCNPRWIAPRSFSLFQLIMLNLSRSSPWRARWGLVLLGIAGALSASAQEAQAPIGMPEELLPALRDILRTALAHSPKMIDQQLTLVSAEATRYIDNSGLYPGLNANGNYGENFATSGTNAPTSSNRGFSYGVSLNQPIFQWGALKNRSTIGKIGIKVAERQYTDAYRMLANNLREQYLALIQKKIGIRNIVNQQRIAERVLANYQAALKDGTVAPSELVLPQMSVNTSQLALDRVNADYAFSRKQLARTIGIDEVPDADVPIDIPLPKYSPAVAADLLRNFMRAGPGVTNQGMIYLMAVQSADLNYKIVRTNLLPKFSLSGNYSLNNNNSVVGGDVTQSFVTSYNFGLAANWPIFDGFATKGAKIAALAAKRASERQVKYYADTTIDQVQSMYQQLDFAARALALAEQRLGMAQGAVAGANENLKLGQSTKADVESATATLYVEQANSLGARADFLQHWTEFVSLVGTDPALQFLPAHYGRTLPKEK